MTDSSTKRQKLFGEWEPWRIVATGTNLACTTYSTTLATCIWCRSVSDGVFLLWPKPKDRRRLRKDTGELYTKKGMHGLRRHFQATFEN